MGRPRIVCSICKSYPVTKNKHDDGTRLCRACEWKQHDIQRQITREQILQKQIAECNASCKICSEPASKKCNGEYYCQECYYKHAPRPVSSGCDHLDDYSDRGFNGCGTIWYN